MEKIIEIPEGYEARIEGNKVVVEPKESEDERIPKLLHKLLCAEVTAGQFEKHGLTVDEALYWLEKRKEPEPGDEDRYMEGYMNGMNDALKGAESAEWSEEDEKMLIGIIERGDSEIPRGECGLTPNQVAWLETRLKSLRPQPKQDVSPSLSEKEITCLKRALDYLRKEHNRYRGEDFTNEIAVLEWLITHPILVSDTHWKPSEDQIQVIYTVLKSKWGCVTDRACLVGLVHELKKL